MQVDEAGSNDDTRRFDALGVRAFEPGHGLDAPVPDHDVAGALAILGRIDQPDAAQVQIRHLAAPARR